MSKPNSKYKIVWPQFLLRLFVLFLFMGIVWLGYLGFKIKAFEEVSIEIQQNKKAPTLIKTAKEIISKNKTPLKGETEERINILLLGMGGEGHAGKYLTDTIILASIDPTNYETSLVSIPRDLYVEIPETQIYTKINAVYTYGKKNLSKSNIEAVGPIKKVVEEITGQEVHYYLTVNFEAFKKIINELGGIIIQVEDDIVDHRYPGPGRSYETFKIDKGTHLVNGDVALKYARVRHVAGGDFGRLKRQQEIISASKRRALSLENFVNPIRITSLLEILGENIQTNIQISEIPAFIELFKNINTYEMNSKVLDAWSPDSLLAVSHVLLGNVNAFILVPRTGNYQEIHTLVENIFNLDKLERQKVEIEKEDAKIVLLSQNGGHFGTIKQLFKKMNYSISIETDQNLVVRCQTEPKLLTLNKDKFFTLTDLSAKFNAEIVGGVQNNYSADIVICLPTKQITQLEKQIDQSSADEFDGGLILDDDGNVLYNES